ncbi:MAG TPA: hypothetical protein VK841_01825 [Polyangiaceae bacterium]|jgi:hypothetical protein|nr:hypothetical protein [Polyangiaceae bacterium]
MSDRPNCVDCAAIAPETNTSHTLISASFGWRLTRKQLKDGSYRAEWRCANCWRKHKEAAQGAESVPKQAAHGAESVAKQAAAAPARAGTTTARWFKR